MRRYIGTITPTRRDLSDPRSSRKPGQTSQSAAPVLNDTRSTR